MSCIEQDRPEGKWASWRRIVLAFVDKLAENPRFDKSRFLVACGYEKKREEQTMKQQTPYKLWIDGYAKDRKTCPNCKTPCRHSGGYFGAYEYIRAKRHLIQQFCQHCFPEVIGRMRDYEEAHHRKTEFEFRITPLPWMRRPYLDSITEALVEYKEALNDHKILNLLAGNAPAVVVADRLLELSLYNAEGKTREAAWHWESVYHSPTYTHPCPISAVWMPKPTGMLQS